MRSNFGRCYFLDSTVPSTAMLRNFVGQIFFMKKRVDGVSSLLAGEDTLKKI